MSKQDRQDRSVTSQDQANHECQEGDPPGVNYSGTRNITASGRTCQVWAVSQPHDSWYPEMGADVGEHNHCRNPGGDVGGVWCYTTDPDKEWEHCSVPICASTKIKVLDFSADNDQYDVRLGSLFFEHLTEYIRRMSTGPIS